MRVRDNPVPIQVAYWFFKNFRFLPELICCEPGYLLNYIMSGYNLAKISIYGASILPSSMQIIPWKKSGFNRKLFRRRQARIVPEKNPVITGKFAGFKFSQYQLLSYSRKGKKRRQKSQVSCNKKLKMTVLKRIRTERFAVTGMENVRRSHWSSSLGALSDGPVR